MPNVRVMGLYGVGGIGKTQICKLMCNELDREFEGKVCHVELGHESEHELVKKVLTTLTNTSVEVVQEVGEDKCRDILLGNKSWNQRTFLTIDNVWDDFDSLEQLKLFLRAPFVEGSWVIVTSRFKNTLGVEVDENACFEMPELDKDDARNMFLHHATNGKEFENMEDVYAIDECIQSCYFGKGEGQRLHYHPLSLKALGLYVYRHGGKQPSIWVKDLQKLKESSYLREPKNPLFTILRSNFDLLPKAKQELFMDVALFCSPNNSGFKSQWQIFFFGDLIHESLMEWLCLVHNKEEKVIEDWLHYLVDNALLEDADVRFGKVSIHDLYREFAKLESQGKLMPLDMEERRWVYVEGALPNELEEEPRDCWNKLTRVYISPITSPRTIEWKYFKKLVVLKLDNLFEISGVLNFKDLICLRSLTLNLNWRSTWDSIEGLEGLRTLTYLKIIASETYVRTKSLDGRFLTIQDKIPKVRQLPEALRVLHVEASVLFEWDFVALCTNLVSLKLKDVCASKLDLKNCTSLREVELINIEGLKALQGFTFALRSSLQLLHISWCRELVKVSGLDCLVGLQALVLVGNGKLWKLPSLSGMKSLHTLHCECLHIDEVPGLEDLVGLKSLNLHCCPWLLKLPSLAGLQCLCKLDIFSLGISELPNLSGLEQLQDISVWYNNKLTSLQGFGNLPALTDINLRSCRSLCQLPDMSELTNLKRLYLEGTQVKCLKDIHMLEGLQIQWPSTGFRFARVRFARVRFSRFRFSRFRS